MPELSEKELKVLRVLSENSDRPQKALATLTGLSDPEFSRTKKELFARNVIQKFTIDINYREIGYKEIGVLFLAVIDKKSITQTAIAIRDIPEAIGVFEAFSQPYDLVIKLMCKDTMHLREVSQEIQNMENIKGGDHTFTIIYSKVYKDEPGVPI